MKRHNYCVYMVASKSRVLYIGMTNNLQRRIWEHKHDLINGFSKQVPVPSLGLLRVV